MGLNVFSIQAMQSLEILALFTFWKLWLHSDILIVTTHFIKLPVHDLTYLLTKSISPGGSVYSTRASHGVLKSFLEAADCSHCHTVQVVLCSFVQPMPPS